MNNVRPECGYNRVNGDRIPKGTVNGGKCDDSNSLYAYEQYLSTNLLFSTIDKHMLIVLLFIVTAYILSLSVLPYIYIHQNTPLNLSIHPYYHAKSFLF